MPSYKHGSIHLGVLCNHPTTSKLPRSSCIESEMGSMAPEPPSSIFECRMVTHLMGRHETEPLRDYSFRYHVGVDQESRQLSSKVFHTALSSSQTMASGQHHTFPFQLISEDPFFFKFPMLSQLKCAMLNHFTNRFMFGIR